MEQKKRQGQNNISGNNKRSKLISDSNSLSRDSFTRLEDLSNELFYEIFDFLDFYDVVEAFSNLNTRFQNLLNDPILPIRISLSFISKSTFQRYYQQIIHPYQHRITLLHLSNPLIIERIFSPISVILKFTRLENLKLCNMESTYLEQLLIHLITLPCLSSLIIDCTVDIQNKNDFYQQIFRLPVLKYCKLSLKGNAESNPLSIATTEFSPIEYLFINNNIYVDELYALLSYVPRIRRLSIRQLCKSSEKQTTEWYSITMDHLTSVSLGITDVTFDEFELIIKNVFQNIQVLCVSRQDDREYMDANRWQNLILSHLPNLRIFNLQYKHCFKEITTQIYDSLLNKFNSSFWFERKWFFEHYIYHDQNVNHAIFFSTNQYRRKHYILFKERNENDKSLINSVNHLEIRTKDSVINCKNYFPNVNEITLFHNFIHETKSTLRSQLNKIIPLKSLTKLIMNFDPSSLSKIIELLFCAPNVHTLSIQLLSVYDGQRAYHLTNSYILQQSKTFRSVSKTNCIKNLNLKSCYVMEYVTFFIDMCPRLQHFTVDKMIWIFQRFIEFVLLRFNTRSCDLVSLCIENVYEFHTNWLTRILNSRKEINADCMKIKNLHSEDTNVRFRVYVWW